MAALTHSVNRLRLLNLAYHRREKGPYAICQEGHPPGSMTMTVNRYYLLSDGSWMLNYAFFLLAEDEQEKHLLDSIKAVFAAIDNLAGKKIIVHDDLPEDATPDSILRAVRETGNRIIRHLNDARAGHFDED